MTTLYEIVRNLLVIIMIASFLELILPAGRLRPLVRFSVGLFVLIAILSPTLEFLFADQRFALGFWDYRVDSGMERSIQEKGAEPHHQVYPTQQEEFTAKLQGQINALGRLVPGVGEVQSEVHTAADGSVSKVKVSIAAGHSPPVEQVSGIRVFSPQQEAGESEEKEVIAAKMMELISSLYEIPRERIEIDFGR